MEKTKTQQGKKQTKRMPKIVKITCTTHPFIHSSGATTSTLNVLSNKNRSRHSIQNPKEQKQLTSIKEQRRNRFQTEKPLRCEKLKPLSNTHFHKNKAKEQGIANNDIEESKRKGCISHIRTIRILLSTAVRQHTCAARFFA
jgi:hypothetical protein